MSERRPVGRIEQIGPTTWRIRVSAGRDPATGRRRRPTKTFEGSQRQAEGELARMVAATGVQPSTTSTTLADYLSGYFAPHAERLRPKTYRGYKREIDDHIVPFIGGMAMDKLTPWVLDQWMLSMRRAGIPDATRNYALTVLRIALRQAIKWRLLESDPTAAVERIETTPYVPQVLTAAEAGQYLDLFYGHALEVPVYLALGAGVRRSESLGLLWADIDMGAGSLTVSKGFHGRDGYQRTKTLRSARTVHFPSWVGESLARHRKRQDEQARFFVGERTPVIASSTGTVLDPDHLSDRYKAFMDEQAIRYVPLKDLRHSHATLALASGTDIAVVSRRLGHSQISTTDRFYVRPPASEDAAASSRFGGLVKPSARPEPVGPNWPTTADQTG
jgi:integrase